MFKEVVMKILCFFLYVIEIAIFMPLIESGFNAMNSSSTIAFISGLVWVLMLISLLIWIFKSNINPLLPFQLLNKPIKL